MRDDDQRRERRRGELETNERWRSTNSINMYSQYPLTYSADIRDPWWGSLSRVTAVSPIPVGIL